MNWRQIQRENFTSLGKLCDFLNLDLTQREKLIEKSSFPLNLPKRLAEKITKGTLDDPILKQFVPFKEELQHHPEFLKDPVGDCQAQVTSKALHKYQGRMLLTTTGACAMHCRYCFRKNFDYAPFSEGYEAELTYIRNDKSLREVILSGGDPLSLSNQVLGNLLEQISHIPHIKRIRFHTRFPIGIPERIDDEFLTLLKNSPLQICFVIHCNHPNELDAEILNALKRIQCLGIPVLNQSVLLKGINDSVSLLQELCEGLVDHGILPYYLHQLDRVQGSSHFEVPEEEGKSLISELQKRLSGYALPRYAKEIPQAASKILIES